MPRTSPRQAAAASIQRGSEDEYRDTDGTWRTSLHSSQDRIASTSDAGCGNASTAIRGMRIAHRNRRISSAPDLGPGARTSRRDRGYSCSPAALHFAHDLSRTDFAQPDVFDLSRLSLALTTAAQTPSRPRQILAEQVPKPFRDRIVLRIEELIDALRQEVLVLLQQPELAQSHENAQRHAYLVAIGSQERMAPFQCSCLCHWYPCSR